MVTLILFKIQATKIIRIMRKLLFTTLFALSVFIVSSCIEQDYVIYDGQVVEFDATVWNAPVAGQIYPLLTRVPVPNRAVTTAMPIIRSTTGAFTLRVNLVAPQSSSAQTVNVALVTANSTAQPGVHFNFNPTVTIPANESFGFLEITTLPGASGYPVDAVFELQSTGNLTASEKFKFVGVRIAQ